jgi:hypothetical protein
MVPVKVGEAPPPPMAGAVGFDGELLSLQAKGRINPPARIKRIRIFLMPHLERELRFR